MRAPGRTLGPLSKLLVLRPCLSQYHGVAISGLNKTKLDLENGALATPGAS